MHSATRRRRSQRQAQLSGGQIHDSGPEGPRRVCSRRVVIEASLPPHARFSTLGARRGPAAEGRCRASHRWAGTAAPKVDGGVPSSDDRTCFSCDAAGFGGPGRIRPPLQSQIHALWGRVRSQILAPPPSRGLLRHPSSTSEGSCIEFAPSTSPISTTPPPGFRGRPLGLTSPVRDTAEACRFCHLSHVAVEGKPRMSKAKRDRLRKALHAGGGSLSARGRSSGSILHVSGGSYVATPHPGRLGIAAAAWPACDLAELGARFPSSGSRRPGGQLQRRPASLP